MKKKCDLVYNLLWQELQESKIGFDILSHVVMRFQGSVHHFRPDWSIELSDGLLANFVNIHNHHCCVIPRMTPNGFGDHLNSSSDTIKSVDVIAISWQLLQRQQLNSTSPYPLRDEL